MVISCIVWVVCSNTLISLTANSGHTQGLRSAAGRNGAHSSRERRRQGRSKGSPAGPRGARAQLRPEEPRS